MPKEILTAVQEPMQTYTATVQTAAAIDYFPAQQYNDGFLGSAEQVSNPDRIIFFDRKPRKPENLLTMNYADSKRYIDEQLEYAKNNFLFESNTGDGRLAYVKQFDDARYKTLFGLQGDVDHKAFTEALEMVNAETDQNIATLLGEVWHAVLSKYKYKIVDGHLVSEYSNRPFIEVIERGQQYREKNNSPWVKREKAEVVGFRQLDEDLANPDTPPGTKWFYLSPPEGAYMHNFGDGCEKVDHETVEFYRWSFASSNEEYARILGTIDPRYKDVKNPDASFFLANPVKVKPGDPMLPTTDAIQDLFAKDKNGMSWEEYQQGLDDFLSLRQGYIARCDPKHPEHAKRMDYFHTMLYLASKYKDRHTTNGQVSAAFYSTMSQRGILADEVAFFAEQSLDVMDLNCGFVGGLDALLAGYGGAFGLSDAMVSGGYNSGQKHEGFEKDQYESLYFVCPNGACGRLNKRPYGVLLEKCTYCPTKIKKC